MKKTKSCIALICAVIMLMTAFVVVPVTANAEGQKASTSGDTYPTLTYAKKNEKGEYKVTNLSPKSGSTSHIWTNSRYAVITAVLSSKSNSSDISTAAITIGKNSDGYYWKIIADEKLKNSFNSLNGKGYYYIQELFGLIKGKEKDYTLEINIPKRNYYVNGFFRVYGNTTIIGSGCTFIKTNDNPVFVNFDDSDAQIFDLKGNIESKGTEKYNGSSNINIENINVNCSNNKKYYRNGFMYAAHASKLNINNVSVKNAKYDGHAFQITAMNDVVIENSTFANCLYYATKDKKGKITGYGKYNRKDLKQYHEIDNGKYGNNRSKDEQEISKNLFSKEIIQIEPDYKETDNGKTFALPTIKMSNDGTVSKNVTIRYCTFSNVMRAIGNHSNRGGRCHIIKIYHNNINNTVGHSIVLSKNKKVYIAANTFDNISIDNIGGYPIYGVKYLVENKWESPFGKSIDYMKKNNAFSNVKNGRKTKEVNLWELASNVKLSKTSINLSLNKSYTLKATVLPALASDKRVKWATSSSKIATVSQNGKVTGKKKGNCIITATSLENNKLVAKCTVTVK